MARIVLPILIPFLVASATLLLGLTGGTLRTGWIDPLDWLLPGVAALMLLILSAGQGRDVAALARSWALVALPVLVFLAVAGTSLPWARMLALAGGLALAAGVVAWARRQGRALRWSTPVVMLGAAFLAPHFMDRLLSDGAQGNDRSEVGVLSALPLQGVALGSIHGLSPIESMGLRSPLWRGLDARFRLRALDAIYEAELRGLKILLLAQPRGLAPEELVALDAWVRRGGRVVILADPLLHWPDPRPLGAPARPPLTSLLDPLLAHWGLRLDAAQGDVRGEPVDRHVLDSGAVLQLSGASRFSMSGGGGCMLADRGLVARCRLGAGQAVLVADADWVNDALWTLDPDRPGDRRAWTSDALDLLCAWLSGESPRVDRFGAWLASEESLLRGLRLALGLLLMLVLAEALMGHLPTFPRRPPDTEADHLWNRTDTGLDTT